MLCQIHVSVVLVESLPVVLVASLSVVVATLLPGVSQGVSMIRSKRIGLDSFYECCATAAAAIISVAPVRTCPNSKAAIVVSVAWHGVV